MADQFKATSEVVVPEGVTVWEVVSSLTEHAKSVMTGLPGRIHRFEYIFHDSDGSKIERKTIDEIQHAVRSLRLEPGYIYGTVCLAPPGSLPWHNDLDVTVWGHFQGLNQTPWVYVTYESPNKVHLDGVRAQVEREAQHLGEANPARVLIVSEARLNPAAVAAAVQVVDTPVEASSSREDTRSWLARTWRDHSAVFLVTVVGTLVATGAALWLGLNQ